MGTGQSKTTGEADTARKGGLGGGKLRRLRKGGKQGRLLRSPPPQRRSGFRG